MDGAYSELDAIAKLCSYVALSLVLRGQPVGSTTMILIPCVRDVFCCGEMAQGDDFTALRFRSLDDFFSGIEPGESISLMPIKLVDFLRRQQRICVYCWLSGQRAVTYRLKGERTSNRNEVEHTVDEC